MRRASATSTRATLAAAALAGAALLAVPRAWAQERTPERTQDTGMRLSTAEELFATAKTLMAEGHYLEACTKFDGSYRLDPAPGTLLNLALCHERVGRTASAWGEFKRVAAESRGRREDRTQIATEHADALFPHLAHLAVSVALSSPPERVTVDNMPLDPAAWGTPVPVDPGPHLVSAHSDGKRDWSRTILIDEESLRANVDVPPMVTEGIDAERPPNDIAHESAARSDARTNARVRRIAGYSLVTAGGTSIVVGAVFGGLAIAARSRAVGTCSSTPCATAAAAASATDSYATARRDAIVADATIGAGAVMVAAGLVLALVGQPHRDGEASPRSAGTSVRVGIVPAGHGVALGASW